MPNTHLKNLNASLMSNFGSPVTLLQPVRFQVITRCREGIEWSKVATAYQNQCSIGINIGEQEVQCIYNANEGLLWDTGVGP